MSLTLWGKEHWGHLKSFLVTCIRGKPRAIHKYISAIMKVRRGRIGGTDHIYFRSYSLKYIG